MADAPTPRSRLVPPDADAIRAARAAGPRRRTRGLPLLGIALIAGVAVATLGDPRRPGASTAGETGSGVLEVRAAAPLRGSPHGAEAEVVVLARWSSADGGTGGPAARQDDARLAVTGWLAARRATELGDTAVRDALREVLRQALFPDGAGSVDAVTLRSIRLR